MTLFPNAIVLIAVIESCIAAVSLGTWAYFANEKE